MNIILRKVRGISGLTPLFRPVGSAVAAADAFTPAFSPVRMLAILVVALLVVALLTFLSPGHALASPEHSLIAAPVLGSLAVKLREKETEIGAKQDKIASVFKEAGDTVDFNKPAVLTLVGAKDSKEVVEKVKAMNAELSDLGKERDSLAEMKKIQDEVEQRRNTPAKDLPLPGPDDGNPERTVRKSLGQIIVGSIAFKKAKSDRGQFGSDEKGFGIPELKTLFQTTAGWAPESTRVPGLIIDKATRPIQVLDVIPSGNTGQAAVKYMEETTRVHNAAERAEAAVYAEDQFVLTERSETVRSIGSSIPVTDEQLDDVEGIQSYLDQRLTFGCRQRLDNQILNGDGNAPNLTGILNKAGIQTQAKAADNAPNAFYKAMVKVRVTGRAFPSAHIMHPTDWQGIRLLQTADGIYIWGSPSEAGPERMWGAGVVQADSIAQGTGLTGDFVNFIQLYERKGLEVLVGYVNDDFTKGKRTIRAGLRVALAIYRAAAFCTVTGL
jgi:HK97 family phage major capsid protein